VARRGRCYSGDVRTGPLALAIALLSLAVPAAFAEPQSGAKPAPVRVNKRAVTPELARQRIAILRKASENFRVVAEQPTPAEFGAREAKDAEAYDRWLVKSAREMEDLARRWERSLAEASSKEPVLEAMKQMEEMNQSFSLQYLQIQQKIQQETREFNLMSNIMKSKHEAAKNAINNIR